MAGRRRVPGVSGRARGNRSVMLIRYLRVVARNLLSRFRIAPLSSNTLLDEDLRHRDVARHPDSRVTLQRFAK